MRAKQAFLEAMQLSKSCDRGLLIGSEGVVKSRHSSMKYEQDRDSVNHLSVTLLE